MKTCGIMSTGETRWVSVPAVGEGSKVGASMGVAASTVTVGAIVGGILVGTTPEVDTTTGAGVAVQAVKRKRMIIKFFIRYMSLRGVALKASRRSNPLITEGNPRIRFFYLLAC